MKRIPYSIEPTSGDLRDAPIYSTSEASFFLDVPKTTLHRWLRRKHTSKRIIDPLVFPADPTAMLLSFNNLTELHILSVITRVHKVKMGHVRMAMDYLRKKFPSPHPLLSNEFRTDGRDLFATIVEHGLPKNEEQLVNFTRQGQLGLAPILEQYLERVERDDLWMPLKFYPVARGQDQTQKIVCIMPTVSSGRPIIDKFGVPVSSLWARFNSGDTVSELAQDYDIPESSIVGALRYVESTAA